jgi:uncharacterized membrane protein YhaH (DUF805 family)
VERLKAIINANRITSRQFWWFMLLAFLVAPTLASLADLALYRLTGDLVYAPVNLSYQTVGPMAVVSMSFGTGRIASMLFWIALLPAVFAAARRLHDTGRPAAWLLLLLIPVIGWFVLLVWLTNRSDPAENAYGPPPTAAGRAGWLPALGLIALCVAAWMWMARAGLPAMPGAPPISAERAMPCRSA